MHTQSHHLLPWASAVLAVLGCGPLVTWAVTLCNYGIYVDEHGLWGVARPIEAALSVSGAGSIIAAIVLFIVWQRRSA
ncbi:hypothetical protein [Brevibacterium luteolum]|uniref:hypothetical protein n=1 Tax=Brevibacterium luteolum TaxID=199591 RepID=UPI0015844937|nr:hypothetical protein [Brevibacterium luteolum]